MAIDTGIFDRYAQPVRSVADITNQLMQQDQLGLSNKLASQKADEYTQGVQRQQQVRQALLGLQPGATDTDRITALKGTATPEGFTQADALEKALAERQKTQAEVSLKGAQTAEHTQGTESKRIANLRDGAAYAAQRLATVNPQDDNSIADWYKDAVDKKILTPEQAMSEINKVPPAGPQRDAWKAAQQQQGMTIVEQATKRLEEQRIAEQGRHNKSTEAITVRGQDVQAGTSRANNRDTIAAENLRAGITPGGEVDANSERTAQAIASGQLPAPTGMALLNPKNQRILGRVMEINPQYDATTVAAKKTAAVAFTTGKQGDSLRSFAVAGQHLDQLGELADALGNGNMQIINRVATEYSKQTGNPAPTNFDAAKAIVSKEVVKAIVAGGGGVEERKELSDIMDKVKSPAQLKGAIRQFRDLMGAQHDALMTQRRAAGLPDSTMPDYSKKPAGGAVNWSDLK